MVSSSGWYYKRPVAHELSILLRGLVARVQRLLEELRKLAQRLRLRTPGHDVGMWRSVTLSEQGGREGIALEAIGQHAR